MFGMGSSVDSSDYLFSKGNVFAYWSAEDAVVSQAGVAIRIPDVSGNRQIARDLTPVSTGPTWNQRDSNFNGRASVSSSTANIRMNATFDTSMLQPYTIYLVMRVETNAATMFWRSNAGNFTNSAGMFINSGPGTCGQQVLDGGQAVTSAVAVTVGNKVSCFVYNGGSSAQYFNDSVTPFAAAPGQGGLDGNSCAVITIGNFGSANVYSWATMICYSVAHSSADRQEIMKFLGNKYRIAIT